jgi:hypothetical protein
MRRRSTAGPSVCGSSISSSDIIGHIVTNPFCQTGTRDELSNHLFLQA